jgi:hypothetical protein
MYGSFALRSAEALGASTALQNVRRSKKHYRYRPNSSQPDEAAVGAALAVLDRFMAALNAGNEPALLATSAFPALPAGRWQDAGVG